MFNLSRFGFTGSVLFDAARERHMVILLKMTAFHNKKIKSYPQKKRNTSRGGVRVRQLFLCTTEEIRKVLKKQGVTDVKTMTIKQNNENILPDICILTFNVPTITKVIQNRL